MILDFGYEDWHFDGKERLDDVTEGIAFNQSPTPTLSLKLLRHLNKCSLGGQG